MTDDTANGHDVDDDAPVDSQSDDVTPVSYESGDVTPLQNNFPAGAATSDFDSPDATDLVTKASSEPPVTVADTPWSVSRTTLEKMRNQKIPKWAGALAGLVSAALAIGVALLLAALMKVVSPTDAVGNAFIDRTPPWLKEWAIAQFGTNDKLVLRISIFVVMGLIALVIGIIATKRVMIGVVGIFAFGVVGAVVGSTQPNADLTAAIPPLVGGVIGGATIWYLLRRRKVEYPPVAQGPLGWDRRRFLSATGGAAIGAGVVAIAGRVIQTNNDNAYAEAAAKTREQFGTAGTDFVAPAGAELDPNTPFVTPNDKFYRIDKALTFPRANLDTWKVDISGMVDTPLSFSYDDLLARPQVERVITICCVSNEVGGGLIGNAVWRGVLLKDLLDEVGVHSDAEQVYSTSIDGWTCGFPVEAATDGRDTMIALSMNGEPLPLEHGYPARLIVPGLYGYVSATKWLSKIELTTWDREGYWVPRGWSQQGPIKTQSRIGFPRHGESMKAGANKIAGVAWAQQRGIEKVEVQVGDGEWQEATLGTDVSEDTWRQWTIDWDAEPGDVQIRVRATDGNGDTQTEAVAPARPDGATGYHTIRVSVQ